MHVVVEAGTRQRALAVDDVEVAAAQLELVGHELEQPPRGAGEEWPVKLITLLAIHPAREDDARIVLGQRDLDVRVGLVVAEEDVVARLVRLDQVVFEEDRLELVVGGDEVDPLDLVDEGHRLGVARAAADEVRLHAAAQVARLADVDDLVLGVLVQIDAGAVGELFEASFEAFEAIHEVRSSRCEVRTKKFLTSSFAHRTSNLPCPKKGPRLWPRPNSISSSSVSRYDAMAWAAS